MIKVVARKINDFYVEVEIDCENHEIQERLEILIAIFEDLKHEIDLLLEIINSQT